MRVGDSYSDLRIRIVDALNDADALGLMDVGIALEMARLQIEKAIDLASEIAGPERTGTPFP